MRSTWAAFRYALVAAAAAAAAVIAHVAIDVAGDYLLPHDTYDGVAHESRAIFVVAILAVVLLAGARILFDAIDRRTSARSLLAGLREAAGSPVAFAAATACGTLLTLAAMELLDCALTGTRVDDVADLVGGSLWLGPSIALACGALAGTIARALVRLLASYEPHIAALLVRFIGAARLTLRATEARRPLAATPAVARTLLLVRSGTKRGPPAPTPV